MVNTTTYVIDTSNLIYHGKWRSDYQANHNFAALLNLIVSNDHLIILITPLLEKDFPTQMQMLRVIARSNGCQLIKCPRGSDPDQIALEIAQSQQCTVISNDKFRQEKYHEYHVERRGFHINRNMIKIHE